MRKITITTQFEKSLKTIKKRGYELNKLRTVILRLSEGKLTDRSYSDHPLKGKYEGLRECHLAPDWLLIYFSSDEEIILIKTGSHADLFK